MNRNTNIEKYTEEGGHITLKKEVAELNKWYDLEEKLHKAFKQSGGDYSDVWKCDNDQWKKLTGRGRNFACFINEIETVIKNLGGKLYKKRVKDKNKEFEIEITQDGERERAKSELMR